MSALKYAWLLKAVFLLAIIICVVVVVPNWLFAKNINQYKDTISNSGPSHASNHSFSFVLNTTINPGASFELIPPTGFVTSNSPNFSTRNVELIVNGVPRQIGAALNATDDLVEITPGSPGLIRYTLNTSAGINSGSTIEIKIGNHTSNAVPFLYNYAPGLGTTTVANDIKPITNSPDVGTHTFDLKIYDGAEVANAGFLIAVVDRVGVGPVDTTEFIPPVRFNGAPTSTVGGTTQFVELSLETDEFATCKYSLTPDVDYSIMANTFSLTGSVFHSKVVPVTPESSYSFYVRCIDDENNFNIDDYLIEFVTLVIPTGTPTTTGSSTGAGSGTGDSGTGSGSGSGDTSGGSSGSGSTPGSNSGGGSGGGGGGGSGGGSGSSGGGGFESTDGPYRSGDGQVTITGFTAPRSAVTFLVDGKVAKTTNSGTNGEFTVVLDLIARGAYTFGVYSLDSAKVKSSTFSTSFTVTGARASALSNIMIPPSILVTPDPVTPGQPVTISGYTLPNAAVTVENEKEGSAVSRKIYNTTANSSGAWSIAVDSNGFANGTYKVRAKSAQVSGEQTNFSNYTLYGVGQAAVKPLNTDLNRDGKVNLVDFSILLFWWGTAGGDSNPPADISSDGKVNLTDFSILLFNWTG